MTRHPRSLYLLALLVPLAFCPSGWAQTAREGLVRLVPDEFAVCLVLNDLRGQHDKLLRSPWVKRLAQSPLGKALGDAPQLFQMDKLEAALRGTLDISWAQLRDEILGDAVVLAYRPGPPGKPEQEEGLMLLSARNRDLLARVMDRLNKHQKDAGELKAVQARKHAGLTYHRRVEAHGESFYFLDGPVLAFTAQERVIRQMLDRRAAPPGKFKPLPLTDHAREAGTDGALATLWINPRGLDAEMRAQAEELKGPEAHALRTFLRYWKAMDGLSLSLVVERDPEIVLAVHARTAALPAAARRVVETAAQPSDLWQRFPKDSLLTAAAQVNLPDLVEALGEFLTPKARKALTDRMKRNLSESFTKQLLGALGPDAGLCIAPTDKSSFPHVLIALRVRPAPPGKPSAEKTLMTAMGFFVGLAVLDHNSKNKDQLVLKRENQDGVEVRYLVNDKKFRAGLRPAFAVKGGYLVLASSPEAVRRFAARPAPAPPGKGSRLLRLSLRGLARFLKDRREGVVELLSGKRGLPPEAVGEWLNGVLSGLDLFDALELTQYSRPGRVAWVARLRPWVPKK
jgi:hypothetical protein